MQLYDRPAKAATPKYSNLQKIGWARVPLDRLRGARVTFAARLVYAGIRSRCGGRESGRVLLGRLARWLHLSRSTVTAAVQQLESAGLIALALPDGRRGGGYRVWLTGPRRCRFVRLPNDALSDPGLTPLDRLIYAACLDGCGDRRRRIRRGWLAARVGCSRRSVSRCLRRLTACQYISCEGRAISCPHFSRLAGRFAAGRLQRSGDNSSDNQPAKARARWTDQADAVAAWSFRRWRRQRARQAAFFSIRSGQNRSTLQTVQESSLFDGAVPQGAGVRGPPAETVEQARRRFLAGFSLDGM